MKKGEEKWLNDSNGEKRYQITAVGADKLEMAVAYEESKFEHAMKYVGAAVIGMLTSALLYGQVQAQLGANAIPGSSGVPNDVLLAGAVIGLALGLKFIPERRVFDRSETEKVFRGSTVRNPYAREPQ